MMESQNNKNYIDTYIEELKQATYHPILNRDIGHVEIDRVTIYFLLLPLMNGERWSKDTNTAAVAVGAIHAAFDAHDAIEQSDDISTQQQLKVLSGDYFSGIHYRLLASLPDIRFIHALSTTIGQINEMKTNFHNQAPNGPEELRETIQMIEAGCITKFFEAFGFARYIPLVMAALPLVTLGSIVEDSQERNIRDILGWEVNKEDAKNALFELSLKMDEAIDGADFLTPFLKEDIRGMTTPLLGKMI